MSFKTPQFLDSTLEIIESHQILSYLGFLASLGTGIFTALNHSFWWTSGSWAVSILLGVLIGWGLTRRFRPIRCLLSDEEFHLIGVRGRRSVSKSVMKFVFKREQESFPFGLRFLTGQVVGEAFSYRYLGRHGEEDGRAASRHLLPRQINTIPGADGRYIYITLPVPAKPNDQYEITRSYDGVNSFEEDIEEAGKCVFHPCKLLKIKIIYTRCRPSNVVAFITKDYSRVAGRHTTLEPRQEPSGDFVVEWVNANAEPGERYTIQWTWV